jgi:hypothetical protein
LVFRRVLYHSCTGRLDKADKKRINDSRAALLQRKAELGDVIVRASQTAVNMASIDRFCELTSKNIDTYTDEDKKLMARALDLKVHVNQGKIHIDGIIPIMDNIPSDYVTSKCSGLVKRHKSGIRIVVTAYNPRKGIGTGLIGSVKIRSIDWSGSY